MFKYSLKKTLRNKMFIFWSLLFPLALMTLFTVAFSGIYDMENRIDARQVAVIGEGEYGDMFTSVVESIAKEDEAILELVEVEDRAQADKLLETGEIDGLFIAEDETINIVMTPDYSDTDAMILKTVADSFMRQSAMVQDAIETGDMSKVSVVAQSINKELDVVSEEKAAYMETTNPYLWYYYSTLVMGILFQAMAGINLVADLQADISKPAMRTSLSPTKKIKIVLSGLLARFVVSVSVSLVALLAMKYIFEIPLGNRIWQLIAFVLLSNLFALSLGQMFGLFFRGNMSTRGNKGTALIMVSVFLSGEMIANLPGVFERYCPIINDINPATVLNLCLYRLVFYENLSTFYIEMAKILAATVLFLTIATLKLRRQKYASV